MQTLESGGKECSSVLAYNIDKGGTLTDKQMEEHWCNANFSIHDNPSEGGMREGHGKIPMVRMFLFISIVVHSNVYLIELVSQKSSRLSSEFVSLDKHVLGPVRGECWQ